MLALEPVAEADEIPATAALDQLNVGFNCVFDVAE